jgi:predicted transcriptional regulator
MSTTIQISDDVKQILDKMKIFERETYNEIIGNMIEDNLELNDRTKKEIEQSRKGKTFSHDEVGKMLNL